MSNEYSDYGPTQRLGSSGIREPCVRALAAILTSAYRPEKITAVFHPERHGNASVLFLVWNWFYPNITIIPDGFGTHGGEGCSGFSDALGLIRFYNVPLTQTWMYEEDTFRALALGTLTEEVFDEVCEDVEYGWDTFPVSSVWKTTKDGKQLLEVGRWRKIYLPQH